MAKEQVNTSFSTDNLIDRINYPREHTHDGIKEVVKPFDWSYSTDYKGTEKPASAALSPSHVEIPIELLKRPDPILFFDDVMLYEDELADNGISMLSCKIRVMPDRLLLLARFFMRLDNVVFRLRDTRVYVDFNTSEVIREYQGREMGYEDVRKVWDILYRPKFILALTESLGPDQRSRGYCGGHERSKQTCSDFANC